MCCFSQPVEHISGTRIFARASGPGRQILVYSMTAAASADLAMVLPLPVPPAPAEDAVRFIDLQAYPDFFDALDSGFPSPVSGAIAIAAQARGETAALAVHDVGDFEASFVPSRADFVRLDARFRMPDGLWDRLPAYRDHGFAVFKLRYGTPPDPPGWLGRLFGRAAPLPSRKTIHPMAFEFPVRAPGGLFYPTLHVHDGEVHADAVFDHTLYAQTDAADDSAFRGWARSVGLTADFVDERRASGVIDPSAPCRRTRLLGIAENRDTVMGVGAAGLPRARGISAGSRA